MDPSQPSVCLLVSMDPPPVHIGHGWAFNVHVSVTACYFDWLAAEETELAMDLLLS